MRAFAEKMYKLNRINSHLKKYSGIRTIVKMIVRPYRDFLDSRQRELYQSWQRRYSLSDPELIQHRKKSHDFAFRPLISIIVPLYNTPSKYFWEMVKSVVDQTYDNWELILVDDASPDRVVKVNVSKAIQKDKRIRAHYLSHNHHIAGATNEGIAIANGQFISLLDHDDILNADALYQIVYAINRCPGARFIYTDEAKLDENGKIYQPFFKPDWNFDLLRAINYITHFSTIDRNLIVDVGGEDGSYNGTQDWEFFLRLTRALRPEEIYHIPSVLYYWRVHDLSTAKELDTKPYVVEAQQRALEADVSARNIKASVIRDSEYGAQWQLRYDVPVSNIKAEVVHPGGRLGDILDSIEADVIIITEDEGTDIDHHQLYAEALRPEIGLVAPYIKSEAVVMKNISSLLGDKISQLISVLSRRSFTKHVYFTTRYSLSIVSSPVSIIEVDKLRQLDRTLTVSSESLSTALVALGYRNVYNPYSRW